MDITKYSDYRKFLKDYIAQKHARQPSWSYTTWGRQLGLSSPSTLAMIVNGQRHPGKKVLDRLVAYFKFSKDHERFFRNLVRIQKKIGDTELTVLLVNQLMGDEQKAEAAPADPDDLFFRRTPYVLREMLQLEDFKEDPTWIADRFVGEVGANDVKTLLDQLLSAGLIERETNGKLAPKAAARAAAPPSKQKIEQLHGELLNATTAALHSVPEELRTFHSSFLSVRSDKVPEAKKLIREFWQKFSELVEEHPGQDVYQLNVHFFPATTRAR